MKKKSLKLMLLLIFTVFLSIYFSTESISESIYKNILNQTIETISEEDSFINLNEGTTRTFKIGNEEFKVNLMMISEKDSSVIIKIDGESLPRLKEGDVEANSKGILVGLVKTFVTSKKNRPSIAKLIISKKGKPAKEVKEDKSNEFKITYAEENTQNILIQTEQKITNTTTNTSLQLSTNYTPSTTNSPQPTTDYRPPTTNKSSIFQEQKIVKTKTSLPKVQSTKSFWKRITDFLVLYLKT